ncbi:MAG: hypothetical protein V4438_01820 [Patescibacteria group bacterium]
MTEHPYSTLAFFCLIGYLATPYGRSFLSCRKTAAATGEITQQLEHTALIVSLAGHPTRVYNAYEDWLESDEFSGHISCERVKKDERARRDDYTSDTSVLLLFCVARGRKREIHLMLQEGWSDQDQKFSVCRTQVVRWTKGYAKDSIIADLAAATREVLKRGPS